ncbi:MAG: hypothetical protein R2941_21825 [Desulfobacterales bacterium]
MKWKEALLLSNMPLEFDAARVLVDEGFVVNSDFRYAWDSTGMARDSAIDLHARTFFPFPESPDRAAQVELLVDCRHRSPETAGIFLPDPNPGGSSRSSGGNSVRVIDQFSPYLVPQDALIAFDADMPVCYKGMEVNLVSGEVDETLFTAGIWQLQNPLPRLLTENVLAFLTGPRTANFPFFFCPVLLTTSVLYVLKKDIRLDEIEHAENVQELGTQTPFLIMCSDMSPDFRARCISESGRLKPLLRTEKAMEIEMKKARYYNSHFNLPFTIIDALNAADYYYLNSFFTRFVICSNACFPEFVRKLKQASANALKTHEILN